MPSGSTRSSQPCTNTSAFPTNRPCSIQTGRRTAPCNGPWTPYFDAEGRLYGRGAADDGYAVLTALATVKALKDHGQPHGRIVILIECSEESGSRDLPYYIDAYAARLGTPSLVICLDSGCGNYEQLWSTTSLRGQMLINLRIEVLREGVHSGLASGIVPNPFMIVRRLLDRLEDTDTGAGAGRAANALSAAGRRLAAPLPRAGRASKCRTPPPTGAVAGRRDGHL